MATYTITYKWSSLYEGTVEVRYFNCRAYSEADALVKFSDFVRESEGFFQAVKCEAYYRD